MKLRDAKSKNFEANALTASGGMDKFSDLDIGFLVMDKVAGSS